MSAFALDPRGSPDAPRWISVNVPVGVPALADESACTTTPSSERGAVVLSRNGVVNAL